MKNLKRLRKRAGLTLTQLAQAADVNAAVIIRMEAGRQRSAIYPTVVRLARALGVTPDELHDPVPRRKRRRRASARQGTPLDKLREDSVNHGGA
jgi:transcriptional regulator with XRE-family HTH domain